MAQILDIDDPLWKTPALREHETGTPLEGFHMVPSPVRWNTLNASMGDCTPLDPIIDWISDLDRPGKVYIEHQQQRFHRTPGGVAIGPFPVDSYFYFTDADVAFEFRMTWT